MAYYPRHPYDDYYGRDDERIPTLRVAGSSDPKSMATAIESRIIEFRVMKLEAVGANSVNQAAKSIAIARANLEADGRGLAGYPDFIHIKAREEGQPERSAIQFMLLATPPYRGRGYDDPYYDRYYGHDQSQNGKIVRVSQKNDSKVVASTIASGLRLNYELRVQAVGPGSVNAAVKAIAIARRTLLETGELSVMGFPEFVRVAAPTPGEAEHSG
eukprot:RCo016933